MEIIIIKIDLFKSNKFLLPIDSQKPTIKYMCTCNTIFKVFNNLLFLLQSPVRCYWISIFLESSRPRWWAVWTRPPRQQVQMHYRSGQVRQDGPRRRSGRSLATTNVGYEKVWNVHVQDRLTKAGGISVFSRLTNMSLQRACLRLPPTSSNNFPIADAASVP